MFVLDMVKWQPVLSDTDGALWSERGYESYAPLRVFSCLHVGLAYTGACEVTCELI